MSHRFILSIPNAECLTLVRDTPPLPFFPQVLTQVLPASPALLDQQESPYHPYHQQQQHCQRVRQDSLVQQHTRHSARKARMQGLQALQRQHLEARHSPEPPLLTPPKAAAAAACSSYRRSCRCRWVGS